MRGAPLIVDLNRAVALAPGDDLAAVAAGSVTSTYLALRPRSMSAREVGLPTSSSGQEEDDTGSWSLAAAQMAERVVGDVAAGLHVVDAGPEDAVAFARNVSRSIMPMGCTVSRWASTKMPGLS